MACEIMGILLHYTLLSAFFWMFCDVIVIYIFLYHALYEGFFKNWKFFMIISWGNYLKCNVISNSMLLFQVFLFQLWVYQLAFFLMKSIKQMKRKSGNRTCLIIMHYIIICMHVDVGYQRTIMPYGDSLFRLL